MPESARDIVDDLSLQLLPAPLGSAVLGVQLCDEVGVEVGDVVGGAEQRLVDRGIRHESLDERMASLRRAGSDDPRWGKPNGVADRLIPSEVPLAPESYLVCPESTKVLALDGGRTVVRPVAVDDRAIAEPDDRVGDVVALHQPGRAALDLRGVGAEHVDQARARPLDAHVLAGRACRSDHAVLTRFSLCHLGQDIRTRPRLAAASSTADVPGAPLVRGYLAGVGDFSPGPVAETRQDFSQ